MSDSLLSCDRVVLVVAMAVQARATEQWVPIESIQDEMVAYGLRYKLPVELYHGVQKAQVRRALETLGSMGFVSHTLTKTKSDGAATLFKLNGPPRKTKDLLRAISAAEDVQDPEEPVGEYSIDTCRATLRSQARIMHPEIGDVLDFILVKYLGDEA